MGNSSQPSKKKTKHIDKKNLIKIIIDRYRKRISFFSFFSKTKRIYSISLYVNVLLQYGIKKHVKMV